MIVYFNPASRASLEPIDLKKRKPVGRLSQCLSDTPARLLGQHTLRAKCTRNVGCRRLTRWVDEHLLEDIERRIRAQPEKLARRKGLVEHPFGTIKRSMNQAYFLTRGLPKVRTEMSLTVLAYNLKRAINILGVPRLIQAIA